MKIWEIIKEIREDHSLSQASFAKKLNVGQTTVSHWELGEKLPSYDNLRMLCLTFDLAPDYLLELSDYDRDNVDPKEKIVLALFRQLDEGEKDRIIEMITKKE